MLAAGGCGVTGWGSRRGHPRDGPAVPRAVARRAWPPPPPPPPRPFWVCDPRGGRPRGLVAASLGELREQDGTAVDTEGFFGALPPHTPLVALAPGQRWDPRKAEPFWGCWQPEPPREHGAPPGAELARVTVALTRAGPRDLLGRLRVTAAIRGLRCDLGAAGPERLLRKRPLWHRVLRQLHGPEHTSWGGQWNQSGGWQLCDPGRRSALCFASRYPTVLQGGPPCPPKLPCAAPPPPPKHARTPRREGGWAAPDAWVPGKGSRDFPMCYSRRLLLGRVGGGRDGTPRVTPPHLGGPEASRVF
ncbi:lipid transferase CIDEB-like isoform X3 [Caloenas nicobarica]|uniref:lipid transferase CIDEB-like isoform X3 n=1 Tax=Caloenas nicobarica TaxID=187106 RepID=UPI0032B6FFAA